MASPQEEDWLNEYFQCWNATEAARRVGYKWPNKVGPAKKQKFADEVRGEKIEDTPENREEYIEGFLRRKYASHPASREDGD